MNISILIHNESCKIDSIEENLRAENSYFAALQELEIVINLYKEENPSQKFYPWCISRGWALDFDDDIMDILDNVSIVPFQN